MALTCPSRVATTGRPDVHNRPLAGSWSTLDRLSSARPARESTPAGCGSSAAPDSASPGRRRSRRRGGPWWPYQRGDRQEEPVPAHAPDLRVLDGAVRALQHVAPLHLGQLPALGADSRVPHGLSPSLASRPLLWEERLGRPLIRRDLGSDRPPRLTQCRGVPARAGRDRGPSTGGRPSCGGAVTPYGPSGRHRPSPAGRTAGRLRGRGCSPPR